MSPYTSDTRAREGDSPCEREAKDLLRSCRPSNPCAPLSTAIHSTLLIPIALVILLPTLRSLILIHLDPQLPIRLLSIRRSIFSPLLRTFSELAQSIRLFPQMGRLVLQCL